MYKYVMGPATQRRFPSQPWPPRPDPTPQKAAATSLGHGSTLIQQQRLLRSDRRRWRRSSPGRPAGGDRGRSSGTILMVRVFTKINATSNETTCQKRSDQRCSARLDEVDLSGNSMWSHTGVKLGYWCQINIKRIWSKSNSITWSVTDRFNEISNTWKEQTVLLLCPH